MNGSDHPPLLKAAIAHAQFETIHPFVDGNGRTGRALIHAILKRDGVTARAVLPISTVFSKSKDHYISGLTVFREDPPRINAWVHEFSRSAVRAAASVIQMKERAVELNELLRGRFGQWRTSEGLPVSPRAGSAADRILSMLMSNPVLTVASVRDLLDVSRPAAERALDELADARVLSRNKDHRGAVSAFVSDEHLNLMTLAERSNHAGGWDTADVATASRLNAPETTLRWNAGGEASP
ncbi:MAG: Fic family protein [Leucobacter sp.]